MTRFTATHQLFGTTTYTVTQDTEKTLKIKNSMKETKENRTQVLDSTEHFRGGFAKHFLFCKVTGKMLFDSSLGTLVLKVKSLGKIN